MGLIGTLAEFRYVGASIAKFLLRQAHFAGEIVQMPHERGQDFPGARIGRAIYFAQHRLSNVILIFDNHLHFAILAIMKAPRWTSGYAKGSSSSTIASFSTATKCWKRLGHRNAGRGGSTYRPSFTLRSVSITASVTIRQAH